MLLIFFWIFAVLMLAFGLGVVISRNPVTSAMSLVMSFTFLACLFFTLDAFFIGIVQVLIYAGAVMVLFLFIIMLLDIQGEERRRFNKVAFVGGILTTLSFCGVLIYAVRALPMVNAPLPVLSASSVDDVASVGMLLFTRYNLPLQVVGVLLLVATMGVVLLSKKELK